PLSGQYAIRQGKAGGAGGGSDAELYGQGPTPIG
ncbi:unnamed protein product, partial [marine sediment metagenome]